MVDYKIHWLKMMSVPESRAVVGRHDGINGRDRLIFAGYEFDDQTDPFEAGIGFAVALHAKTNEDFIGKEALMRRKEHPSRTLVGLELAGNEPAAHGDPVHVGRSQVGVVTSAMRSPILRKNIALCRMAVEHAALGTAVEVGKLDGRHCQTNQAGPEEPAIKAYQAAS